MARARRWRDVRAGLLSLVALGGAALGVLLFARVGALHGGTVRLYAVAGDATGIIPGSEVWLAGQRVGLVRDIAFRPPSSDTTARLVLALDVLDEHAEFVRRDAEVTIGSGGSFIGSPVVHLGTGSSQAAPLRAGDTLRARPGREFDAMRLDAARAGAQVPAILANLRVLGAQLGTARGTLGALGVAGTEPLAATSRAASALLARVTQGDGVVGATLSRGEPLRNARRITARVDTVRALLASPRTSVGRLRADSALPAAVAALRADLALVAAALDEPRGTAGRLQHDPRLEQEIARARAEVDALIADLRNNPARYLRP